MNRRHFVLGATGLAAGLAGIAVAWRSQRRERVPEALWTLELPRVGGGTLAFASLQGKPLLVNFWATWCVPCVVEMPLLQRFHASNLRSGWQVVGIAVDQEPAVAKFIAERGIHYPIVMAGMIGMEVAGTLGNAAGGLPFSIATASDGHVLGRRLGAVDDPLLADWVSAAAHP